MAAIKPAKKTNKIIRIKSKLKINEALVVCNVKQNIDLINNKIDSKKVESLILGLGLTQKSEQMVSELSVGEAQRVAIARGLANSPRVIFADEPTSSLDDCNTQKVMELILDQTKQMKSTLIVSTHDKRIKKYFYKITEMSL